MNVFVLEDAVTSSGVIQTAELFLTHSSCNSSSRDFFHKHTALPLYLLPLLSVCVFFSPARLCTLIVFRFNRSLFPHLVSLCFPVLSFRPPPSPPLLRGLVFSPCRGSSHVSLAGRN